MVRIGTILCIFAVSTACRRPEPAPAVVDSVSTGRFLAEYEPADPDFREFRSRLIANRSLDTIATRLNDSIRIPQDIILRTAHSGEPNASSNPDSRRVTPCYELSRTRTEPFAAEPPREDPARGTLMLALLHEP